MLALEGARLDDLVFGALLHGIRALRPQVGVELLDCGEDVLPVQQEYPWAHKDREDDLGSARFALLRHNVRIERDEVGRAVLGLEEPGIFR